MVKWLSRLAVAYSKERQSGRKWQDAMTCVPNQTPVG